MRIPRWEDILLGYLPLPVYRDIRDDLIDIFISAYLEYPKAREAFGSIALSDLRKMADKQAVGARNLEPFEPIQDAQAFVQGLYSAAVTVMLLILLFAFLLGATTIVAVSRQSLSVLLTLSGLPYSIILGASAVVAFPVILTLLFVRMVTFSSFVVKTLNNELVIGVDKTATRDKSSLAGYYIWNSSMNGGKAVHLLSIFVVLKLLSLLPYITIYETVRDGVRDNMDVFVETESIIQAIKILYRRYR